jgi:YggT family protein
MPTPFETAGLFLVNVIFDLYLLVLMIRLLLCWANANYFNPITHLVLKLTQPIVGPLRRIIPNIRKLETSTLVIILLLEMIKYLLIGLLLFGLPTSFLGLLCLALTDALKVLFDTFFYAILLQAILSWVQMGYSPISQLMMQITAPVIRPFRRLIPPVGGFDLSPIPALILLQLISILLIRPLLTITTGMTFG